MNRLVCLLSKKQSTEKVWKAVPLPYQFHTSLETGDWMRALHAYQRHPYHAPPVDTFDLLKAVMHATGVRVEDVKSRFNEKIRLSAILQKKTPEEVGWEVFWQALNKGDSKTISAALMGARLSSVVQQIATAEACAVLLKSAGENWTKVLVDDFPFATVTRCNLVQVALLLERWDVAVELLKHVRVTRSDMIMLWELFEKFDWEKTLMLISACPKNSVPFDRALSHILRSGCSLRHLSEHLENAKVLGDADVVAPLLAYAVEIKDWEYVGRGMDHLVDIGQITQPAREVFEHMGKIHGTERVCRRLSENGIPLHRITVERLEGLKL
ncbi:unnamed protein product [Trypanosoma congolense IL3000]|uniref:Uncharacterized protein n=1 Tax=Trypanosoma congolense (strain IL3000) TaxID=1068625 RepID=F9W4R7_TRYCI|nr:conserved hypothetical protein [Trypanosoma congolense IL3000]CCD12162.1 unnamed protein product [Trypanosoma congolense IL3000]